MMPLLTIKLMEGFLVQRVRIPSKVFPCRPFGQYLIWPTKALKYLTNSYAVPCDVKCNWADAQKYWICLLNLRPLKSRNVHVIGAHVRPFHSITSIEQSIQLWVGQRGVWYASWQLRERKKMITYQQLNTCNFPLDRFLLKMPQSICHFSSYKLNKAILQKWLIEWRSDI